jgi:hypothetical protein
MRFSSLGGLMAIALWVPTLGIAAGTDLHDPGVEIMDQAASATAGPPYLGCGAHRHYDPKARKCFGPENF